MVCAFFLQNMNCCSFWEDCSKSVELITLYFQEMCTFPSLRAVRGACDPHSPSKPKMTMLCKTVIKLHLDFSCVFNFVTGVSNRLGIHTHLYMCVCVSVILLSRTNYFNFVFRSFRKDFFSYYFFVRSWKSSHRQ